MSSNDRRSVDAAFATHKREQAQRARSMTPAERLRWLETAVRELGKLRGLARPATKPAART
jgi:hypothetical protein